ncbi:hypothetical protein OU995_14950 [Roseateles sp. SL47]|uniref:alpha/beta hydrolase family protein n=1 Tax=Roseateles sp. SL47 TaxID=2995138 RepID=UPI00227197C0|nr:hypothetical protein [Roseateles sp. SL47]WAC70911.1 hypothetical protein OU995_14950 [Roseateles sp. SL47]
MATSMAAIVGACVLLAGCGGPPKARLDEQRQQQSFAAQGYSPVGGSGSGSLNGTANGPGSEPVSEITQSWRLKNDVFRVTLTLGTAAASGTPRPVVVYLPGLGESDIAGRKWRQTWASAGYAVVSLQPLETDAQAWASDLARAAEFKRLGQQHYAQPPLRQRLATLDAVLAEAQRRGRSGELPWSALDWTRTAVAGYELGAQAAMALAGESLGDGTRWTASSVQLKAVVVISPQVMDARAADRYAAVLLPVLGLTGPQDTDVLGLVEQPRWRTLPFESMPKDNAWLLSLPGITHATLAGNDTAPGAQGRNGRNADGSRDAGSGAGGGGGGDGGSRGRRGGGMGGGMGGGPGGGMNPGSRMLQPVPDQPDWHRLQEDQLAFIAAQKTSLAFLDWQLKQAPQARDWLMGPAQVWLGRTGQLTSPLSLSGKLDTR